MSDVSTTERRAPWAQAIATVAVTVALGPPIGGLIFALCVALLPSMAYLAGNAAPRDPGAGVMVALFVALFAIPFSYLIGAAQALAVGIAFSAHGWLRGRPPFWFAVVAGLAVYAVASAAGFRESEFWFAFLLINLLPTLLCWALVRLFWAETAK